MESSIYIIIPVHNRRETTLNCLQHLYGDSSITSWKELKILVVDDGSTDGTSAAISANFPKVRLLEGDGNLWWTGAIRKGMEYAYEKNCKAVFWLNDDCPPEHGSLRKMYQASLKYKNAIIGAACYIAETSILKPTGAKGRVRISAKPDEVVQVDEMSGHCVCIPKAVIDAIGFPNTQRYPHYHGDSSYSLRATRAGFDAYILGNAKVTHPGKVKANLKDFSGCQHATLFQTFHSIFMSRKSLYYWPTQFFYNTDKYGLFFGTPLFLAKVVRWSLIVSFFVVFRSES